jgi:hypothetical protein
MLRRRAVADRIGRVAKAQRGSGVDDEGAGETMMSLKVPTQLRDEIRAKAVKEGVTLRVIVLRALKAAGFEVEDGELADRRPAHSGRRKGA